MVGRFALLFWMLLSVVAHAAEIELRLVAPEIERGQVTALRVVVQGSRPVAPPKVSTTPDVGIDVRFESQANRVSIANAQVREYYEFVYRLTAFQEGTFTVGPVEVDMGGRIARSQAVSLHVRPKADRPAAGMEAYAGFGTAEGFVGQVVVFRRGIRSSQRILQDRWPPPPLDGLLPPRDGDPGYAEYSVGSEEGTLYVKEEYYPRLLVSAGQRDVPVAMVRVMIEDASGLRDRFGRGRAKTDALVTEAASLNVRPLPPGPSAFSGLVGGFSFSAEVDRVDVPVGGSVTVTVRAQGNGSFEGFSLPRWSTTDDIKVYDGTPVSSARVDASGYSSEAVFSRVVVPTRTGRIALPDLEVVTFDPARAEYVTHRVPLPSLNVSAGKGAAGTVSYLDDVETSTPDASPAYEGVRDPLRRGRLHAAWLGSAVPWWLGIAVAPLIVLMGWESGRVVRARWLSWRATRTPRQRTIAQRLASLPREPAARLREIDSILVEQLRIATGNDTRHSALEALPESLRERTESLARRLELARFADGDATGLESEFRAVLNELSRFSGRTR
jgi:hypothetical protein